MGSASRSATGAVRTILFALGIVGLFGPGCAGEPAATELESHRLIGKAYYENDEFEEASREFRKCIELDPKSAVDHFNLALILMRALEHERALEYLEKAQELDPDLIPVNYCRGIIHKRENRFEEAIRNLQSVVDRDPTCRGAYYNLGVCYKFLQKYQEAIASFKEAETLAPDDPSTQYQLMTLYNRIGDVENADRHEEIHDRVKDTVDEAEKTVEALERSKYTFIITPRVEAEKSGARPPGQTRFRDATVVSGLKLTCTLPPSPPEPPISLKREGYDPLKTAAQVAPSLGGAILLEDCDGDGDLDIYLVNCAASREASKNRLFRNDGCGRFADATDAAGVGDTGLGLGAVFGDFNNDGRVDLYVANCGPNVLYRQKEDGTFEDVSQAARGNEPGFGRRAVFLDYDHDNDLDLYVINDVSLSEPPDREEFSFPDEFPGEANTLLRNNGNGTFTDLTDQAGLLVEFARSQDVAFADFEGDADIDIFYINADGPSRLFLNARLGKFREGGSFSPAISGDARAVAEGDFNRDGKSDLIVGAGKKLLLYTNNGRAEFIGREIPLPPALSESGVERMRVFDSNNDGRRDLLLVSAGGQRLDLLSGVGRGEFRNDTGPAGLEEFSSRIAGLATGDLDGDGDEDIVLKTFDRGPVLLMNESQDPGSWLCVRLVGKKSNRSGYGSTVEIASAGGHYQKQTFRESEVHFGLGNLKGVEVVRVTWPNGIAQNVIRPDIQKPLTVEEFVRVSVSCGFLYSFNGKGFELVNEILGVGPLGAPLAPGVYYPVDCTELTKIESSQLVEQDGVYELRLTEELREITYADQITLRVIDHPAELEVVPNEMFTLPPFPEDKFFAVAGRRPPVSAVDGEGKDVRELIVERDGKVPEFPLTSYLGIAEPHSLVLDFGDLSGAEKILLCLDGWIYWPEGSVTLAVAQDPRFQIQPLLLEVRDRSGNWKTAVDGAGLPTSKGMVVPVDLTGKFPGNDYHVRLSTNLCVYLDRIFVSTRDNAAQCRQRELPVATADLRFRGFSSLKRDALGFERFDYDDASPIGAWNPPKGLFTRYGDVTELLSRPDDRYVIFGPGDELALRFDARGLPQLPPGWIRDFIFYANGWVKDGDLNTKFSETVAPLPFHGMSGYPYPVTESYPDTPEHRRYLREYNTRPARCTVGALAPGE